MTEKEQAELKQINLENDLLELQKRNFDKSPKRFFAYISIIVTILALIVSIATNYYNQTNKNAEIRIKKEETKKIFIQKEIDIELKLMSFFLNNHDKIFSKKNTIVKNMALVLATFPSNHTNSFFEKIIELSDSTNREFWKETKKQIEKIEKHIEYNVSIVVMKDNLPIKDANILLNVDKTYKGKTDKNGQVSFKINQYEKGKLYTIIVNGVSHYEPINNIINLNI